MEDGEAVVDEVVDLAVLRAIEAEDIAALELVKTREMVLMGLKKAVVLEGLMETGVDAGAWYGGGWTLVLEYDGGATTGGCEAKTDMLDVLVSE
jgi:hypothetical protein